MTEELVKAVHRLSVEIHEDREQRRHQFHSLNSKLEKIMATQAELVADLKAVNAQQVKTLGEIETLQKSSDALSAKIVELEAVIAAGGTVTQELIDAVAAVKAQAQIVDDQIPDVVPVPIRK